MFHFRNYNLFCSKNRRGSLFRAMAALLCLLTLSACSDFADIFRRQGKVYRKKPSQNQKNRDVALKKNRKDRGQVVHGLFQWPVDGEVSSGFGSRWGRLHDGIDIRAPGGTPVYASAAGEVIHSDPLGGYGKLIVIRHRDNYFTAYAHNTENLVKEGKLVEQGDLIARVGDTGNATGYHLHFEVRQNSAPMDPMLFLPDSNGPVIVKKMDEKPMEASLPPAPPVPAEEAPSSPPIALEEIPSAPSVPPASTQETSFPRREAPTASAPEAASAPEVEEPPILY